MTAGGITAPFSTRPASLWTISSSSATKTMCALFEESLGRARDLGCNWGIGRGPICLGDLARVEGDHEQACSHYTAAVRVARKDADEAGTVAALDICHWPLRPAGGAWPATLASHAVHRMATNHMTRVQVPP